eukprot:scaffold68532_cov70-Phaeocystis_antarctica.AAC.8
MKRVLWPWNHRTLSSITAAGGQAAGPRPLAQRLLLIDPHVACAVACGIKPHSRACEDATSVAVSI